jgi:plastocyanin
VKAPEGAASARAAEHVVLLSSFTFSPPALVVQPGDTVTWRNTGGVHNVVADDRSFRCAEGCDGDGRGGNGDASLAAWSFSLTFDRPGSYPYYCELHGFAGGVGMAGSVEVVGEEGCVASPTALCLAGGRFRVEAAWRTAQGLAGDAMALPLTADTGLLWFFSPSNLELVVKVLDGCPVNGRFWVFAAGLTDVAVTLTVTDTATGAARTYESRQGTAFPPVQDTAAFAGCP